MRFDLLVNLCLFLTFNQGKADTEIDKFQGVWQVTKLSSAGKDAAAAQVAKMVIHFQGDQMFPKDNPSDIARIKVSSGKKNGEIDTIDKGKRLNRGIYRFIDANTLEICMNVMDDAPRPKDFVSPKDSNIIILTLKRIKE
jgi:uncharacterized protein (TIGR03067 family)